jgi:hypothetical protein
MSGLPEIEEPAPGGIGSWSMSRAYSSPASTSSIAHTFGPRHGMFPVPPMPPPRSQPQQVRHNAAGVSRPRSWPLVQAGAGGSRGGGGDGGSNSGTHTGVALGSSPKARRSRLSTCSTAITSIKTSTRLNIQTRVISSNNSSPVVGGSSGSPRLLVTSVRPRRISHASVGSPVLSTIAE